MPLKLEIVTPEARIFSDEVDTVVLPGFEGEMGVLPSHAPLVTTLQVGELRYTKGGKTTELAVGEGLVEVTGSTTRVLTDMAIGSDDIDEKAVEEALERAKRALEDLKQGEQQSEVAAVMAMIQRSTAQLHLKRKRKTV
ncbi:F-type H+-transporting ATPase subunit epsilon [Prosthecobacter debontii]|uniref:ATP synthase epsilon chain n=1 Tax=Prosthecobacter debontii TaxID=48467 RepID=A0A1T4XGE0_9BACT|nr:ATP synthase F1 subunit epsilon [Prosthecobacter debontii]SKA88616.1 F-type H+-transporting ATPase subunit epsilon [Prosthecobacter debontii]